MKRAHFEVIPKIQETTTESLVASTGISRIIVSKRSNERVQCTQSIVHGRGMPPANDYGLP